MRRKHLKSASLSSTHFSDCAEYGFVPIDLDPEAAKIDPILRAILKRFDKKDTVTKQKALNELIQCVEVDSPSSQTDEAVLSALPYWPRIFSRMLDDEDKRVRELAIKAMSSMAERLSKKLAPQIKQILPDWVLATTDSHYPVASLARESLQKTFPAAKSGEAFRFCSKELLDLLDKKVEIYKRFSSRLTEKSKQEDRDSALNLLSFIIKYLNAIFDQLLQLSPEHVDHARIVKYLGHKSPIWKLIKSTSPAPEFYSQACLLAQNFCAANPLPQDQQVVCLIAGIFVESLGVSAENAKSPKSAHLCLNSKEHWKTALAIFETFDLKMIFPDASTLGDSLITKLDQALLTGCSNLETIFEYFPKVLERLPIERLTVTRFFNDDETKSTEYLNKLERLLTSAVPSCLQTNLEISWEMSSSPLSPSVPSEKVSVLNQSSVSVSFGDEHGLILGSLQCAHVIFRLYRDEPSPYLDSLATKLCSDLVSPLFSCAFSSSIEKKPFIAHPNL
ncbi:Ufm1-specific protease 2, partial [Cichlidogyrus casuarinus]